MILDYKIDTTKYPNGDLHLKVLTDFNKTIEETTVQLSKEIDDIILSKWLQALPTEELHKLLHKIQSELHIREKV